MRLIANTHSRAKTELRVIKSFKPLRAGTQSIMHLHYDFEFIHITKGAISCRAENDIVYASEGDVIFLNSRVPHQCEVLEDGTMFTFLQFANPTQVTDPLKYLVRYLYKNNCPYNLFKKGDDGTEYLAEKIQEILANSSYQSHAHDYLMIAKKCEIIAFLFQNNILIDENELINSKKVDAIIPIIEYINKNYSIDISLNDISNHFHLHRNYLCKLFKNAAGITFIDYLNYVRIREAEPLLKSGLSVTEVSERVGFSSQTYFSKVFKKYYPYPPSEYKKRLSQGKII